jgi:predicted HTH domain antitoxin
MQITIEIPHNLLDAIHSHSKDFAHQAKMAMASKLYELGTLSTGMAAQLVGIERGEFLLTLSQYGVAFIDLDQDELLADLKNA